MTDIIAKPFDWNDNLSKEALEDFEGIRKDLPYCTCQNIGMALAKLELLEKQGCKVIDPSASSSEKSNKCEDAISRQAVLDAINTDWHEDLSQLIDAIKALPPVEPKQKMGHWIKNKYGQTVCSECQSCALEVETGCLVNRHLAPFETNYCPNCGAKMAEGSEA